MRSLVWFRNDLRVADQPALAAAASRGEVVACFCICAKQWRQHDMSDWRIAFMLRSLQALRDQLEALQIPLKVINVPWFKDVPRALVRLSSDLGVDEVHFNDEYPLDERNRDQAAERALIEAGVAACRHQADVAVVPGKVLTGAGEPYSVFSPFYRNWSEQMQLTLGSPEPVPGKQQALSVTADELPDAVDGVDAKLGAQLWPAGETVAAAALQDFLDQAVADYPARRDIPSCPGTSQLSHHLALGSISVRQCIVAARHAAADPDCAEGAQHWIRELAWRDFYRHVVAQFDHVNKGEAFKADTEHLPWRDAPQELAAWQAGETGYPLVDAAMRQLNQSGWMHNRLRMVAAMFLTKHLLIDWRQGERYFMRHLIDGDFASNNGGWQWSASTGTDAVPYFRIFNPSTQGMRFDPEGNFTLQWLPELSGVAPKHLFEPHKSGQWDYPAPIVEHRFARERALEFFQAKM